MKKLIAVLAIFGAIDAQQAGAQVNLRFLNAFHSRYSSTIMIVDKYAQSVKEASGGRITMRMSGPEVVNAFEQFEPVSRGAFDLLFTTPPYFVGTTSVPMGVFALEPDPEGWRRNGVFDFLDREFQRFNLKLLAIYPGNVSGKGAFQILIKEAVSPGGALNGKKIRGNRLYQPMLEALGSSMVNMQVGEVYSAMQKGVVDGAIGPVLVAVDLKWYEVGKFMVRPRFGQVYMMMVINADRLKSLPPADQKILSDEARKIEVPTMQEHDAVIEQGIAELKKRGVAETMLSQEQFDKSYKAYNNGVWQTVTSSKATAKEAKAFHDLARSKGLAK